MSTITDVKCVLTQKELDAFCNKFHILEEVHPILPNQNDTMHERPAGKIRIIPTVGLFRCFYMYSKKSGYDFTCPAFFSWHTAKHVTRDPAPVAADFNAQDYATLVAHPFSFWKYPEVFMCLVRLSRHYTLDEETYPRFLHKNKEVGNGYLCFHPYPDPTKVRVFEHEQNKVAPDHAESELEASVDRLFDVGGSGNQAEQRDSAGGEQDANIQPVVEAAEKLVEPSLFGDDSFSAGGNEPTTGVFSYLTSSYFLVGTIHTVINPDTNLQKLSTEFKVRAACQISLSAEVRMHAEYNVKEKRRLKFVVERQGELLMVREEEIENIKARLLLREPKAAKATRLRAKASNFKSVEKSLRDETNALRERNAILKKERNAQDIKVTELKNSVAGKERELTGLNALITSVKSRNDSLVDQVHELEISSFGLQEKVTVYQNCMEQLEKFQDNQMKVVNDKFDKLYTDFVEMALHLEEKLYPHLLTTISDRRWLLTQGIQDGLSVGITHGKEGRVLIDVVTYNPFTEVDYIFALLQLQNVNFPLLAELKSNKDASIGTMMDILRLEGPLVDKLGLDELQPNFITHRTKSALCDVFVPLAEPFSAAALTDTTVTCDLFDAVKCTCTI
nr:hypothetical protein [Tanacetum cinerariifolium]